jgi:hypothetical protein
MKAALVTLVLGSALAWGAWATTELIDRPTKDDFGTYMELISNRLDRIENKLDKLAERGR